MLALAACEKPHPVFDASVVAAVDAGEQPVGEVFPSRRCGECHGRQKAEWAQSLHAQAASGVFLSALAHVPEADKARCGGCHVPLEFAGDRIASDGVGCDSCHTAVGPSAAPPAVVQLKPELATRFGPFKDSKDHNFHRVGYSEFVVGSALCVACHEDAPGAKVPTYTTASEWRADPNRADCESCHMPGFKAVAAKGERERNVSSHVFRGEKAKDLARAIDVAFAVKGGEASVTLTNTGATHALPTGRPERRLRLEVTWLSKSGAAVRTDERVYARSLVDEKGAPAPSFLAVREAADSRLLLGAPRKESFARAAGASQVVVHLWYEPFDPKLSSFFEPTEPLLVFERKGRVE